MTDGHTITIPIAKYDRLIERVKRQADQIRSKDEALHQKNLLLDALHMVWCDGACYNGVHRYEDRPVTEELVVLAERNTARLRRWFESVKWRLTSGEYPTTTEYHRQYLERIATKVPEEGTNMTRRKVDPTQAAFPATLPCPDCKLSNITGLLLVNKEGQHNHTHYYCRTWQCGWHGWSVPGWDDEE